MKEKRRILDIIVLSILKVVLWVISPVTFILTLILDKVKGPIGKALKPVNSFFVKLFSPVIRFLYPLFKKIGIGAFYLWIGMNYIAETIWQVFVFVTRPLVLLNNWLSRILPSWVKAVLSMFIWGLGQLLNRQYIKALMFFLVFFMVIGIEYNTGNYGKDYDFYNEKLAGEEAEEEFSNGFIIDYYFNTDGNPFFSAGANYEDVSFLELVADENGVIFDEVSKEFKQTDGTPLSSQEIQGLTLDVLKLYEFLGAELRRVEEQGNSVSQLLLDSIAMADADVLEQTKADIYTIATNESRGRDGYPELLEQTISDLAQEDITEQSYSGTLQQYIDAYIDLLTLEAEIVIFTATYDEIYDDRFDVEYESNFLIYHAGNKKMYYNEGYGDIVKGESDVIDAFDNYIYSKFFTNQLNMDNEDANKMLLRIYFEYRPEEFTTLIDELNNPFYEQGGIFVKGVWGVATLGSVPQTSLVRQELLGFLLPNTGTKALDHTFMEIKGHNSTKLLLEGIITGIALFYVLLIFIWNVTDAFKTSVKTRLTKKRIGELQYFKDLYENFFEYIVLMPALLLISFISVMPIFFGLAVAFTNFAAIPGNTHIPPGQLIDWVGFENFKTVFNLTSGSTIDFAGQFWSVFSWTLIWAVGATFTCFFGGFLQAVILSNKRVVFRKFWRSILILPWAVPALISQMIFRVMFNDIGFVNNTLKDIGVVKFFQDLNILGLDFIGPTHIQAMDMNAVQRFFYMGEDTFQWLSNAANPWFVRVFIILLNIWLGFPFFMALMSGVMTSIDKSLYEAASIDGATGYQQFKFITMPLVLFATSPLLVMTFSGNFNNFGVIYFITGGGPGGDVTTAYAGSTDILISWIYKLTTDTEIRWYNMASVFSILIFIVIGSLSAWNFSRTRAFKEGD